MIRFMFWVSVFSFWPILVQSQEKPNLLAQVVDDPKLPRVLIIGDSISMGYTGPVRKQLAGKANVHRIGENGGPTSNGVVKIDQWLGNSKWDVIHFNFGLHDIKMDSGKHQVSIQDYEKNLRELVKKLQGTQAKLIWASTTPVPSGNLSPKRRSEDAVAFNAVAKKIMDENSVKINDLYNFALPRLEKIQMPMNVHFTNIGSEELGKEVSQEILKALGKANEL